MIGGGEVVPAQPPAAAAARRPVGQPAAAWVWDFSSRKVGAACARVKPWRSRCLLFSPTAQLGQSRVVRITSRRSRRLVSWRRL